MLRHCPTCRKPWNEDKPMPEDMDELYKQTPIEVWREYFDNGYTWSQAIRMEFSYA